ncbi:MAG: hypothetical protein ACI38A_11500 [Candidatus Ornithomonoglobus sp.]
MSNLSSGVMLGLWIFFSVVWMIFYWKSVVLIFNLGGAIVQSIVVSIVGGVITMLLTLYFWKLAVVLVLLIGLFATVKAVTAAGRGIAIVLAIIMAIVIGVVGHGARENAAVANYYTPQIQCESI